MSTYIHRGPNSATTCRYICNKFGAISEGITLSPVQAQRANELSAQVGLGSSCNFQVGDALAQPFADDTFDLAWSLESGEHMPDKKCALHLLGHCERLKCRPGVGNSVKISTRARISCNNQMVMSFTKTACV